MSVGVVSREPVTQHVMYGEWKGYPPGEDHRFNLPRLDTTNGELLAQLGPTASNIAEGDLSTHTRALASVTLCLLVPLIYFTVPYSE